MENIRKFNTEQEYDYVSVGNSDIISYITDCDCVRYNSAAFVLTFTSSSNESVKILGEQNKFSKAVIDGKNHALTSGVLNYTFQSPGKHIVKVWLNDIEDTAEAFSTLPALIEAIIPHSCKYIGAKMFYKCPKLRRVILHGGIKLIGSNAFNGCTLLDKVKLFAEVAQVGNNALEGSSITKIAIPAITDNLGKKAFYNCHLLEEVVISALNLEIAEQVFDGCEKVKTIYCESKTAPSVKATTFGNIGQDATDKVLYIPEGASGYDTGYWAELVQKGFTIQTL